VKVWLPVIESAMRQAATHRTVLPADLSPGQYRFNTNVEVMAAGEGHRIASNAFRVNP
jgi:hypothetical protein